MRPRPQPPCALALLCAALLCAEAGAQGPQQPLEPLDRLEGMTADAPVDEAAE